MSIAAVLGETYERHPLKDAFLKWQCHTRQMMMRDLEGRPSDAVTPAVTLPGADAPLGHIITILNKSPGYSQTPEMEHMFRKTNDPAQIRQAALGYLSATYYQKHREFSDILTATFPPGSAGAAQIRDAGHVTLSFDAFAQRFDLECKVWRLAAHNPLHQATLAHNQLFNPAMPAGTEVLGFEPSWDASTSEPAIGGRR